MLEREIIIILHWFYSYGNILRVLISVCDVIVFFSVEFSKRILSDWIFFWSLFCVWSIDQTKQKSLKWLKVFEFNIHTLLPRSLNIISTSKIVPYCWNEKIIQLDRGKYSEIMVQQLQNEMDNGNALRRILNIQVRVCQRN